MKIHNQPAANRTSASAQYLLIFSLLIFSAPLSAGEIDLSDEVNVKLARIKAKTRQTIHTDEKDYIKAGDKKDKMFDKNNGDCGAVDIGNLSSKKQSFGPKKVDVIIVGDVINAGNKC
ncbi:MAG: hypothetical protein ACRBHB_22170 [Arenicella sp.]